MRRFLVGVNIDHLLIKKYWMNTAGGSVLSGGNKKTMKNKSSNSYSHALKYTGLFGGVQVLNMLIGLVRNKLVALILGPAGMGLVSLYNSTVTLISNASNLGLSMSGVRTVSDAFDNSDGESLCHAVKLIRSLSMLTAIAGTLLCALLSPLLSEWTFGGGDHMWDFVMLSPMVGMIALITGEMTVMKGVRMLNPLAVVSVLNVLAAVLISVPIFYFYGQRGIVPSLLLLTLTQLVVTLRFSCRRFPMRLSFGARFLRGAGGLLSLGVAFVLSGVLGSGADFLVRMFLNSHGSLDAVGLYNAGYVMTMVYGGMVFSAMETDYFPRLSAVRPEAVADRNDVVNRQIEVSLLLVSPMLAALVTALPFILPMLFSSKFMPVLQMVQVMVLAMYLRALKLPMSYLTLARGDSRSFLVLEALYDVVMLLGVCLAYAHWGLMGAGYGLLVAGALDFIVIAMFMRMKYCYRMSCGVLQIASVQLPLGVAVFVSSQMLSGLAYWVSGVLLTIVSLADSVYMLHRRAGVLNTIRTKLHH